ncbi:hypothetical protein [Bdellovibrio sp. HCB274]|uniref:hypothetical protein n=1 Tax=Bdellovibrio sp. HCB274 TaxID=3394361 RepID=UPI0039B54BCF
MRFSFSKLVIVLGTPIVLMGYQNCAKLGTENLLGKSSVFVADESIDLSSTSTPSSSPEASTPAELLTETKQSCYQISAQDDVAIQSCLNLFCNPADQIQGHNARNLRLCQRLQRLALIP